MPIQELMKEITDMKHSLGKFMTLFVLGVLAVLNSCTPAQIREAESVIERTFGSVPSNVEFSLLEKKDSLDMYAVSVHDGCLKVEGTSSIALCKGFYDFILENGYGIASWTGNRLEFPEFLADCPRKEVRTPFRDRLYYNVCTYGYTTPFWDWDQWEKEIDWMALHGFTMPLAPIAGEAILSRVWTRLGLSQEEIDAYFTGPAHLPWMRMGNMTAVDGGMSQEWHDSQVALQHRINDRMLALGMTPVYQGFAGFVPKAVKDHYPEVDMMTTSWQGHESYMLSPLDSLFSVIGTEFIREWEKEFGKGKYYLIDSFNELDIPFGEKGSQERADKLKLYSKTIYDALAAANPDAVWVMQGWMFGYQREIWDSQSVEALLSGAPDDRLLVIDLAVDFNNYVWRNGNSWDNLNGFYGKSWLWSTVPNFGGRSALKGPLEFYLNGHLEALSSENKGRLTGFGTSPEGVENNEILYELISAASWSDSRMDLDTFLEKYSRARYGECDPVFMKFWNELRQSVYDNFTNNARFLWQLRPAYHRVQTMNINEHYFKGIEAFLSVADKYKDNELYVTDAVQYAAMYIAAKADYVLKSAAWALVAGDFEKVAQLKTQLADMLLEADRLLESHPVLRIQRWLDMADDAASDAEEAAAFRKEVRRLVSTWSGSSLRDYSARVWSGLIRDYYVPRLDYYFENAVKGPWVDVLEFDRRFHDAEGGSADASYIQPYEDPLSAACELVMKYSSLDYSDRELNPYSPDREVTYWCPQDFGDKKTKRLYMTIHAADFAKMEGLKIRGVRGSDVRISRLEVKSGPQWLGNRELNLLVKSSGGEKKIPFKGPGTTDGLEREVGIYLTIEGGPQTWGTISLY